MNISLDFVSMHLPVSNHGNILPQLFFFCLFVCLFVCFFFFFVGLERVDGITVLGKLDWSIGGKQLSITCSFTSLKVQLVTTNACVAVPGRNRTLRISSALPHSKHRNAELPLRVGPIRAV